MLRKTETNKMNKKWGLFVYRKKKRVKEERKIAYSSSVLFTSIYGFLIGECILLN